MEKCSQKCSRFFEKELFLKFNGNSRGITKKIISFFFLSQGTQLYHRIHGIEEKYTSVRLAMRLHGTRQRARAKTAHVVPPSNSTPRTCPHSACPCTRNGVLLPSPPTAFARMHVPAHMTTPYSRIFSSQWL